jgi:hypothetical protein
LSPVSNNGAVDALYSGAGPSPCETSRRGCCTAPPRASPRAGGGDLTGRRWRLADDDKELLAAVAGDGVDAAHGRPRQPTEVGQHGVASRTAVAVVDLLEAVEVEQQDGVADP